MLLKLDQALWENITSSRDNTVNMSHFVYVGPDQLSHRAPRCCDNCKTEETPTWRSGPEGSNLCNACGLQFRRKKLRRVDESPIASVAIPLPRCAEPFVMSVGQRRRNSTSASGASTIMTDTRQLSVGLRRRNSTSTSSASTIMTNIRQFSNSVELPLADSDASISSAGSLPSESSILWLTDDESESSYDGQDEGSYSDYNHESNLAHGDGLIGDTGCGTMEDLFSPTAPYFSSISTIVPCDEVDDSIPLPFGLEAMPVHADTFDLGFSQAQDVGMPFAGITAPSNSQEQAIDSELCPTVPSSYSQTHPHPSEEASIDGRILVSNDAHVAHAFSCAEDFPNGDQCKCQRCLLNLFLSDRAILVDPLYYLEQPLHTFVERAAGVHLAALQRKSSIYVATERFIWEIAGKDVTVTAFAILREDLELTLSSSSREPPLRAARCDLVFDYVVSDSDAFTQRNALDDWLYEQSIVSYLTTERARTAIWDISRLPPGPTDLPNRGTFRWLQRTLLPLSTSGGLQVTMNVESGNDQHQFRRFHQAMAIIKHVDGPYRLEMYASLESGVKDASIKSCQEWFIAVLDEAVKRESYELQLQFVEANKVYMLECMEICMRTFHTMNYVTCLHICSSHCTSHVQPTFESLVNTARNALQELFPSPEMLGYIQGISLNYPTSNQLFHARIVGLSLFKLYFSHLLLPKELKVHHSAVSWALLADARVKLTERTQAVLIWNYLPVDIARRAASKLARATEDVGSFQALSVI